MVVRGDIAEIADPGSLPIVVAWVGERWGDEGPSNADLVIGPDEIDELAALVERTPLAAATAAVLLRTVGSVDLEHGLSLESAAYSVLQSGPEFDAWRQRSQHRPVPDDGPVVTMARAGGHLGITLDRPQRHNAITAQLRDELHTALATAVADPSITSIIVTGNGPSFCSGGDLGEFGLRPDPATAHVTRLTRSPARLIHQLRDRITVSIHGATMGGGIEMAAFAGRVVAHPETRIALPEIALGLIPGAGGTVSLTRRIGRQRTAALTLTGRTITTTTALAWGLVDEVSE